MDDFQWIRDIILPQVGDMYGLVTDVSTPPNVILKIIDIDGDDVVYKWINATGFDDHDTNTMKFGDVISALDDNPWIKVE